MTTTTQGCVVDGRSFPSFFSFFLRVTSFSSVS